MWKIVIGIVLAAILSACGTTTNHQIRKGFQIGSMTSKNLFVDSSQFANRTIKLRLRNSSGDTALDVVRLRNSIETGLRNAGYQISDRDFGIVMDVNAYQMQTALRANVRSNSGIGALLGGVVGYETARRPGGIASGSGAIIGAVAGAAIEEIINSHGETATYLALCEVNIGVVRKEYKKQDRFVIGGNKIEHREDEEQDAFTNFVRREDVRIAVFAGDDVTKANQTVDAVLERLGRVIANLI
jgi:outer membrane lipoprotein SlyB